MSSKLKSNSSKGGQATSMAELLANQKSTFVKVSKGEIIEGTITKLTPSEILVDIGAKTESVVLEKDRRILKSLLSTLKVGDKVTVSVLNPESDMGNPVVSLRRFNDQRVWDKLDELKKNKTQVEATLDEVTKGGFLVSTDDGISGFLPNSQTQFLDAGSNLLGKKVKISIIELNRALRKVIVSQKSATDSTDFNKAVKTLKRGEKIETTISNVAPFGIFTQIKVGETMVEGFVHISEVSWEKSSSIPQNFKQGQVIEAQVLGFDRESKRINLSIKNLTQDPFEEKLKNYNPDQKIVGKVSKVLSSGVLVELEEGVEGFIKKEKIPPTMNFKEGITVDATVSDIDAKKHRVNLVPVLKEKPIGYR